MCRSTSLAVKNDEQRRDAAVPAKSKLFSQRNKFSFGTPFGEQNNHLLNQCYAEVEKQLLHSIADNVNACSVANRSVDDLKKSGKISSQQA